MNGGWATMSGLLDAHQEGESVSLASAEALHVKGCVGQGDAAA